MISTVTMVRSGKTYGNLMVDLRPTNAKLRERATRIIQRLGDVDRKAAQEALAAAGGNVKLAIGMVLRHVDADEGGRLLDAAHGRLRAAIAPGAEVTPATPAPPTTEERR
jgi:N-acetylmuramic acid 6-phosphate etherase